MSVLKAGILMDVHFVFSYMTAIALGVIHAIQVR